MTWPYRQQGSYVPKALQTQDELVPLVQDAQSGDTRAMDELAWRMWPLVRSITYRHRAPQHQGNWGHGRYVNSGFDEIGQGVLLLFGRLREFASRKRVYRSRHVVFGVEEKLAAETRCSFVSFGHRLGQFGQMLLRFDQPTYGLGIDRAGAGGTFGKSNGAIQTEPLTSYELFQGESQPVAAAPSRTAHFVKTFERAEVDEPQVGFRPLEAAREVVLGKGVIGYRLRGREIVVLQQQHFLQHGTRG